MIIESCLLFNLLPGVTTNKLLTQDSKEHNWQIQEEVPSGSHLALRCCFLFFVFLSSPTLRLGRFTDFPLSVLLCFITRWNSFKVRYEMGKSLPLKWETRNKEKRPCKFTSFWSFFSKIIFILKKIILRSYSLRIMYNYIDVKWDRINKVRNIKKLKISGYCALVPHHIFC